MRAWTRINFGWRARPRVGPFRVSGAADGTTSHAPDFQPETRPCAVQEPSRAPSRKVPLFSVRATGKRVWLPGALPAIPKAAAIEERKRALGLTDDRLRIRTVPVGDPGIGPEEADMAFMAHRFLTIADRDTYFQLLRRGLREPRPLYMLEWQNRQTPMGPPVSERRSVEDIMDMISTTGYSDVGAHSAKIPDQVIFIITDYIDLEGVEGM